MNEKLQEIEILFLRLYTIENPSGSHIAPLINLDVFRSLFLAVHALPAGPIQNNLINRIKTSLYDSCLFTYFYSPQNARAASTVSGITNLFNEIIISASVANLHKTAFLGDIILLLMPSFWPMLSFLSPLKTVSPYAPNFSTISYTSNFPVAYNLLLFCITVLNEIKDTQVKQFYESILISSILSPLIQSDPFQPNKNINFYLDILFKSSLLKILLKLEKKSFLKLISPDVFNYLCANVDNESFNAILEKLGIDETRNYSKIKIIRDKLFVPIAILSNKNAQNLDLFLQRMPENEKHILIAQEYAPKYNAFTVAVLTNPSSLQVIRVHLSKKEFAKLCHSHIYDLFSRIKDSPLVDLFFEVTGYLSLEYSKKYSINDLRVIFNFFNNYFTEYYLKDYSVHLLKQTKIAFEKDFAAPFLDAVNGKILLNQNEKVKGFLKTITKHLKIIGISLLDIEVARELTKLLFKSLEETDENKFGALVNRMLDTKNRTNDSNVYFLYNKIVGIISTLPEEAFLKEVEQYATEYFNYRPLVKIESVPLPEGNIQDGNSGEERYTRILNL